MSLKPEDTALIDAMTRRLAISPDMAKFLTARWGQTALLLQVAREEGEERLRTAMKGQWRRDDTCSRLDEVRSNIAGTRPGDAEAIASFQQEFIRMKEARPAMDDLKRGRLQGIACTLAALAATHHSDSVVLTDILDGLGLDLAALQAAGAEAEDLAAIRKGLQE